eukprot:Lankesteria_metandrocarpae@DN4575_c0_g1_i2.p1
MLYVSSTPVSSTPVQCTLQIVELQETVDGLKADNHILTKLEANRALKANSTGNALNDTRLGNTGHWPVDGQLGTVLSGDRLHSSQNRAEELEQLSCLYRECNHLHAANVALAEENAKLVQQLDEAALQRTRGQDTGDRGVSGFNGMIDGGGGTSVSTQTKTTQTLLCAVVDSPSVVVADSCAVLEDCERLVNSSTLEFTPNIQQHQPQQRPNRVALTLSRLQTVVQHVLPTPPSPLSAPIITFTLTKEGVTGSTITGSTITGNQEYSLDTAGAAPLPVKCSGRMESTAAKSTPGRPTRDHRPHQEQSSDTHDRRRALSVQRRHYPTTDTVPSYGDRSSVASDGRNKLVETQARKYKPSRYMPHHQSDRHSCDNTDSQSPCATKDNSRADRGERRLEVKNKDLVASAQRPRSNSTGKHIVSSSQGSSRKYISYDRGQKKRHHQPSVESPNESCRPEEQREQLYSRRGSCTSQDGYSSSSDGSLGRSTDRRSLVLNSSRMYSTETPSDARSCGPRSTKTPQIRRRGQTSISSSSTSSSSVTSGDIRRHPRTFQNQMSVTSSKLPRTQLRQRQERLTHSGTATRARAHSAAAVGRQTRNKDVDDNASHGAGKNRLRTSVERPLSMRGEPRRRRPYSGLLVCPRIETTSRTAPHWVKQQRVASVTDHRSDSKMSSVSEERWKELLSIARTKGAFHAAANSSSGSSSAVVRAPLCPKDKSSSVQVVSQRKRTSLFTGSSNRVSENVKVLHRSQQQQKSINHAQVSVENIGDRNTEHTNDGKEIDEVEKFVQAIKELREERKQEELGKRKEQ